MNCVCSQILDNRNNDNIEKTMYLLAYLRKRILAGQKFSYTNELKEKIQYINQKIEFFQEIEDTKKLLDSTQTYEETMNKYDYYQGLVKNDISLVQNLHNVKSVVFVGSGPLPITAILLQKLFDFKVTAIECDQAAYDLSMQVLDKFNLTDKIEIVKCFGSEYSHYGSHDLICLSSFMNYFPEEAMAVEKRIIDQTIDIPVLARTVSGDKQLIYRPFSPTFFKVIKHIYPPKNVLNESLLLSS